MENRINDFLDSENVTVMEARDARDRFQHGVLRRAKGKSLKSWNAGCTLN